MINQTILYIFVRYNKKESESEPSLCLLFKIYRNISKTFRIYDKKGIFGEEG